MNPPLPSAIAHQDFAAQYEQLRCAALGRTNSGGVGLTVLLGQGLAAWVRACLYGTSLPARNLVPLANAVHPPSSNVRSQAAVILAGIILHLRPETNL